MKAGLVIITIGLVLLARPVATPKPTPADDDLLSAIYHADRVRRVALIRDLDARTFDNDAEKADWHNSQSRAIVQDVFKPYVMALAEAIDGDTLADFAESLEPAP